MHPPRWLDKLLEWLCAPELREEVLGDLYERYYRRAERLGEAEARRYYWREVLSYVRCSTIHRKSTYSTTLYTTAMLRNYLKLATRNVWKNKVHTAINTLGMAVAIASILLIFLYVRHELTYDQFHRNSHRIMVLGEQPNSGKPHYSSVFLALPQLLKEYPAIENGTRIFNQQMNWLKFGEKEFQERITFADTGFFQVFTFPLLKGDSRTILADPSSVVLAQETADKLFGTLDPIGQTIRFDNGKQLVVRGVLAPIPANSSIEPKVIVPITSLPDFAPWIEEVGDWYNTFTSTYLLLRTNAGAAQLEAQLPAFVNTYFAEGAKDRTLRLLPFEEMHKHKADNTIYVYGLTGVAIFLLLVACINFTNLSTATSLSRIREIAIRKTLGSTRTQLVFQFLSESLVVSLCALLIGLLLTELLLPVLNEVFAMQLRLDLWQNSLIGLFLISLAIGVGLLAGIYPALYFSGLRPVNALKGKLPSQPGGQLVRKGLVVVQFSIAVFLIAGTLLVYRQIQFMKHADLRFDRENVLVLDLNLSYQDEQAAQSRIEYILNELRNKPEVISFSTSETIPGRYWENYNGFVPEGETEVTVRLRQAGVDDGYLSTYGIRLLEGRNFSSTIARDTLGAVIINRAAMQAFGWDTAVGKTFRPKGGDEVHRVVGVMEDFHYQSLQGPVEPLVHWFTGPARVQRNNFLSIKVQPEHTASVISFLQNQWREIPSRKEFSYFFVDEEFNKQYLNVERTLTLITLFTSVTLLIACAGVFALTSLSTHLRIKEIGIRKVLGASVSSIVTLLYTDFLKLILVANLIAWPLVYYAMQAWLEDFAYRISISPWLLLSAGIVTLLIAILTISYQSIKAALSNPVDSLRNE